MVQLSHHRIFISRSRSSFRAQRLVGSRISVPNFVPVTMLHCSSFSFSLRVPSRKTIAYTKGARGTAREKRVGGGLGIPRKGHLDLGLAKLPRIYVTRSCCFCRPDAQPKENWNQHTSTAITIPLLKIVNNVPLCPSTLLQIVTISNSPHPKIATFHLNILVTLTILNNIFTFTKTQQNIIM